MSEVPEVQGHPQLHSKFKTSWARVSRNPVWARQGGALPLLLAFWKARQEGSEFKASLVSWRSTGQSRLPGKTKQSQTRKKTKLSGEGGAGKKGPVFRSLQCAWSRLLGLPPLRTDPWRCYWDNVVQGKWHQRQDSSTVRCVLRGPIGLPKIVYRCHISACTRLPQLHVHALTRPED